MKLATIIEPSDNIVADSLQSLLIKIEIGEEGIKKWGGFRLYIPPGWSLPQLDHPQEPGYTTIEIKTKCEHKLKKNIYTGRWIAGEIIAGQLSKGDTIEICYGNTKAGGPGAYAPRVAVPKSILQISVDQEGNYTYQDIDNSPCLKVIPGPVAELKAIIPSYRCAAEIPVMVMAIDRSGNIVGNSAISVEYKEGDSGEKYNLDLKDGIGNVKLDITEDKMVTHVHVSSGQLTCRSNPAKKGSHLLLWGDLHGHSNLSDGRFSPAEYFAYARDKGGLDFASLTDHDNVGSNSNVKEHSQLMSKETWAQIKQATNKANQPHQFVTLIGYEYTQIEMSTGGHRNIYYLDDDPPIFRSWDLESNTPTKLFNKLKKWKGRVIVIPHHPLNFMSREHDPDLQRLFEIYSMWGGSETADDTCAFKHPVKYSPGGKSFIEMLNYDYRMGVVAGGDNHDSMPGFSKATDIWRKGKMAQRPGLTAVFVEEKTREALFAALYNRHCYATTGERILLEFAVDGQIMGSEVKAKKPYIKANVVGTCKLERVQLVKNGLPVIDGKISNEEAILEYQEEKDLSAQTYYYIRVIQQDGEKAWSSPIWVNPVE